MKLLLLQFLICSAFVGCTNEEPASPNPLTSSTPSVNIILGTLNVVEISGGIAPYHIVEYPAANVATVSFEDSTKSPANILIIGSLSSRIADTTRVVVGDSNPLDEAVVSITIKIVEDGLSYSANIQPIWDVYCKNRGCHPGGGAPYSLEQSVSYSNLYYAPASNQTCGAVYRVIPFDPDSSLLYLLITGRATSCPRMPFSQLQGDTLSLSFQVNILTWILEGAVNN